MNRQAALARARRWQREADRQWNAEQDELDDVRWAAFSEDFASFLAHRPKELNS